MSDDPGFFQGVKMAIVGLGLMGGSLAMALRSSGAVISGCDPDPDVLDLALRCGVVDDASPDPAVLLPPAEIVILAAPVRAILQNLHDLPHLHPGAPVVIDLGSTKVDIVTAMQSLPERFEPLGGHPICGKESSSLRNADEHLFQNAPFVFTPQERTTPHARQVACALARQVAAIPLWMDAQEHDRCLAATSHLPYLVSNALAFATPGEDARLAGPGFRSTARLAASSPQMMIDILATNRSNILSAARHYQSHLELLIQLLERGDFAALQELMALGAQRQQAIIPSS